MDLTNNLKTKTLGHSVPSLLQLCCLLFHEKFLQIGTITLCLATFVASVLGPFIFFKPAYLFIFTLKTLSASTDEKLGFLKCFHIAFTRAGFTFSVRAGLNI